MGEPPCFNLPIADVLVYLGLGTNLGDRIGNLRDAVKRLANIVEVEAVSRVYESPPAGYADQPDFLNVVVRARTDLSAAMLFKAVKDIEREMGRQPSFRNAPRLIDIDILLFGDETIVTEELEIPHPRMTERGFVMLPLAEVYPEFKNASGVGTGVLSPAAPIGELQ